MFRYLVINRKKISICLDYEIHYFHHFEIGDIIKMDLDFNLKSPLVIEDPTFHLDWDEMRSARVSARRLLELGHLVDVTRDEKIKLILEN